MYGTLFFHSLSRISFSAILNSEVSTHTLIVPLNVLVFRESFHSMVWPRIINESTTPSRTVQIDLSKVINDCDCGLNKVVSANHH